MDARLMAAAQTGNTNELYNCIREDAKVLSRFDEVEFVDNPVHIAAARGHADFVTAIMYLKPSLACKLNLEMFSPMHLASQNDHKDTVLSLLAINKDFIRVKGKEGYTPLHHVAREGNLYLLTQFLKHCPPCIEDLTIQNETALHIAAQNNRLEALEILTMWIERTHLYRVSRKHVLYLKDRDGNTVLHIAATNTQPQMIKQLLEVDVDTKETNNAGLTALNILENQRTSENREKSLKILKDERRFDCLKALLNPTVEENLQEKLISKIKMMERVSIGDTILHMSTEKINILLVVLTLILTATYQAIVSPPGGVWQGDPANNRSTSTDKIGKSVMNESSFDIFFILNMTVFVFTSNLTVILLEVATNGGTITLMVEALLASLISSVFISFAAISPNHELRTSSYYGKLIPYTFFMFLLIMEVLRRWARTHHRRLQFFNKLFR